MQLLYYYLYPDPLFYCGTNLLLLELDEGTNACLPPLLQQCLPPALQLGQCSSSACTRPSELLKTAASASLLLLHWPCGAMDFKGKRGDSIKEQQRQQEQEWCAKVYI